MKIILGFSLGKSKTKVGLINQYGEVEQQIEFKNSSKDFLEILKEKTISWLKKKGYDFFVDVERIGVSIPGLINHETGIVIQDSNLAWNNYPLKENFKKIFLPKPVSVLNNINAQALAEFWVGSGKKTNSFIYYQFDGQESGAIVLEGKLLIGEHNLSSHFNNLSVNKNSALTLNEQLISFLKDEIFTNNNLKLNELFFENEINVKKLRLDDLIKINEKDYLFELLKPVITKYLQSWLEQIAILINALDFKTLILNGKICLFGQNFREFIEKELKKIICTYFQSDLKVFLGNYETLPEVIGAAYHAIIDWEW